MPGPAPTCTTHDQSDLPVRLTSAYNRKKAGLPLIFGPNMPENPRVVQIVRSAVNQALERQLVSLRETVVQEVLREIRSAQLGKAAQSQSSSSTLQRPVLAIQSG